MATASEMPLTRTGVEESVGAFPLPSSPDALLPHAIRSPSDFSANPKEPPAAIATTPLPGPRPCTATGLLWLFGAFPLPSSPDALLPHARTWPSAFSAMACDPPAATAITPLPGPSPFTSTGVDRSFGAVPSPSSPDALLPHARTWPFDLRAKANEPPAATATTPLLGPRPFTRTGSAESTGAFPSPSSPDELLPQAYTAPLSSTARLNAVPAETARTSDRPTTSTGVARSVVVPSPN